MPQYTLPSKKRCSRCEKTKHIAGFYIYTGNCGHLAGKPHAACKDCEFAARSKHRRDNPLLASAAARRAKLKRLFGITPEQYDGMFVAQGGLCAVCYEPSPDGRRLHVDHCHSTMRVRGLLCHDCNRGLGIFKDSVDRLASAVGYLKRSTRKAARSAK